MNSILRKDAAGTQPMSLSTFNMIKSQ